MKKRILCLTLAVLLLCGLITGCNKEDSTPTTEPISENLPDYTAGHITKLQYDVGTTLSRSMAGTYAQFEKYCADMEASGYEKLYERDTKDLRCAAFQVENEYIYAYYAKRTGEARVIRGPLDTFSAGDCKEDTGITASPTLTLMGQPITKNNGLGVVFVLPDGRLIIYDGGFGYTNEDPEAIYTTIKSVAPDKENIVIAGWFMSHPHNDHVTAFLKYAREYSTDETIHVQRVIFNFADHTWYDFAREDGTTENCGKYVLEILKCCREKLPGTQVIKAHTGQVYDFGDTKVEIMHTVEDQLPAENLGYVNTSSMVIRVNIAGQSVLLLGDSTSTTSSALEGIYQESLSSDMVQLAHHGMWAGTKTLYFYVHAPVLLWPTLPGVAEDWLVDQPVLSALTYAKDIYIAGTGCTTLQLPYQVVGNKQQVLSTMNPK
jgi:hypothetical protein